MGIKGLWTVLTPYSEKKSLHEIRGETIAVDLSGWVCDSQNVTDYYVQPKLYLRNLFFRTIYLLLADINPIFVLEGDAPDLKRDVMAARNAIQFRGAAPRSEAAVKNKRPDVGRKRFKNVLKECESLLKCMGVQCIKGRGEAEATCAQLNAQGLVDAVISQDSDCFAYGARRVYRNFSVSSAAGGGAMQGSVDCYDADKMLRANGFGRNKMVALAMLCGCDYGVGACGSSINTAVAFIHTVDETDIIPRLISWVSDPDRYEKLSRWATAPGRCDRCGHVGRTHLKNGCPVCGTNKGCSDLGHNDPDRYEELSRWASAPGRCDRCGHVGRTHLKNGCPVCGTNKGCSDLGHNDPDRYEELSRWASAPGRCDRCGHVGRTHLKNGCPVCGTNKGCSDLGHKAKVAEVKRELSLRSRAVSCGMPFPEPKVMKEFLNNIPEQIDVERMKATPPSLIQFMKLMSNKLEWSEKYCVEKFLPLLTKWHLQENVPRRTIKPMVIKKKRHPRGVPSYEVIWEDIDGLYEGIIPDDQFDEDADPQSVWTTIERQDLMRQYYPELVEAYEESIKKPPKEKKTRAKKKKDDNQPEKPKRKYTKKTKKVIDTDVANLSGSFRNIDLSTKACDLNSSKANLSVSVNRLKRKLKTNSKKKQKTIESFIAKKRKKSIGSTVNSLRCSLKNMSIKDAPEDMYREFLDANSFQCEKNPIKCDDKENHLLSMLDATIDDDDNENDLSDIIDNIVSRTSHAKTAKMNNNLVRLVFQNKFSTPRKSVLRKSVLNEIHNHCSTPNGSPIRRSSFNFKQSLNNSRQSKVNTSYFFDKLTEDRDAFEMSVEYNKSVVSIKDCDTTVDYSLPDVCF
ncbi:flap endonuclease GEN [Ostrinia nubilalis]|uniref:flap endonuclease GEN n=1 Tax=Ostrinia nubilalis TaxID=29057 RepID=UPI0030822B9B